MICDEYDALEADAGDTAPITVCDKCLCDCRVLHDEDGPFSECCGEQVRFHLYDPDAPKATEGHRPSRSLSDGEPDDFDTVGLMPVPANLGEIPW